MNTHLEYRDYTHFDSGKGTKRTLEVTISETAVCHWSFTINIKCDLMDCKLWVLNFLYCAWEVRKESEKCNGSTCRCNNIVHQDLSISKRWGTAMKQYSCMMEKLFSCSITLASFYTNTARPPPNYSMTMAVSILTKYTAFWRFSLGGWKLDVDASLCEVCDGELSLSLLTGIVDSDPGEWHFTVSASKSPNWYKDSKLVSELVCMLDLSVLAHTCWYIQQWILYSMWSQQQLLHTNP